MNPKKLRIKQLLTVYNCTKRVNHRKTRFFISCNPDTRCIKALVVIKGIGCTSMATYNYCKETFRKLQEKLLIEDRPKGGELR
jgi:hypothetical protein